MRRFAKSERGYNLVEVLLAMGLLASVLISIMALFFFGRRNVYSGKQMTNAVSVATHVLEDINTMNKTQLLAAFNLAAVGTGGPQDVFGQHFDHCFVLATDNIPTGNDPAGFLARWHTLVSTSFDRGVVTLVFVPTADGTNDPAQFATSDMVRCRVFVTWNEAARPRQVTVDALKIDRQGE